MEEGDLSQQDCEETFIWRGETEIWSCNMIGIVISSKLKEIHGYSEPKFELNFLKVASNDDLCGEGRLNGQMIRLD